MNHPPIKKKKSRFVEAAWKILVIFVGLSMILGMILPFISLGQ